MTLREETRRAESTCRASTSTLKRLAPVNRSRHHAHRLCRCSPNRRLANHYCCVSPKSCGSGGPGSPSFLSFLPKEEGTKRPNERISLPGSESGAGKREGFFHVSTYRITVDTPLRAFRRSSRTMGMQMTLSLVLPSVVSPLMTSRPDGLPKSFSNTLPKRGISPSRTRCSGGSNTAAPLEKQEKWTVYTTYTDC